jgi:hypothetical protein
MASPVRIGNFSGAIGDRFGALEETVMSDPPVDVATGDYMAEITMSMVSSGFRRHPESARAFYADYFLRQVRPLLGDIARRGVKVVVNAGVFNPAGLADALRADIAGTGLPLNVAYVRGDDILRRLDDLTARGKLRHLDSGEPFTGDTSKFPAANAYLGGWGIAAALQGGADIVVTGRVADASLVLGPAAWWHGWASDEFDKIAGAVAAGHVIECGPQATGGNFSGFAAVPGNTVPGFPVAEIAGDGSSVITKRPGEGGTVTVDTVTAQLMYEIQGPRYLNPDVVLHVDSIQLSQEGVDRVRLSGVKGSPAPETTKAGLHFFDGFRAATWAFPTGLQLAEKLDVLRAQAAEAAKGLDLGEMLITPLGMPAPDPATQYDATVAVRVAVSGPTAEGVEAFCARFPSYGLGSIPGFYIDFLQGMGQVRAQARVGYWPGLVPQSELSHEVVFGDGRVERVPVPPTAPLSVQPALSRPAVPKDPGEADFGPAVDAPLGAVVYTRAGDKGGDANLGVWVPDEAAYPWLRSYLTAAELARLLRLEPGVVVERHEMDNLHGISFVLRGFFGRSGSGNLGLDSIGKAIGEFLRARHTQIPAAFVGMRHGDH